MQAMMMLVPHPSPLSHCHTPPSSVTVTPLPLSHCTEMLVNIPQKCAHAMLLPPHVRVMPTLHHIHPSTYPPLQQLATASEDVRERDGRFVVCECIDLSDLVHSQWWSGNEANVRLSLIPRPTLEWL